MRECFFLLVFSWWTLFGFAQDSGQAPSTTATSQAGSQSQSGVVNNLNLGGNVADRQFIGAVPGAINPGPFPGYPIANGKWQQYYPAKYEYTAYETDAMKGHTGKVHFVPWTKEKFVASDKPSRLIPWWPKGINIDGDEIKASGTVTGKYLWPEDGALAAGLAKCRKYNSTRVAVRVMLRIESATIAHTIGLGGAGSGIARPAEDNAAVAVASGAGWGKNVVRLEDYPEFEFLCMNDGPFELPKQKEQSAGTTPAPPAPAVPPAPPPPQRVDVHIILEQAFPQPAALPPSPATPECDMLSDAILFGFNERFIRSGQLLKLQEMTVWLAKNKHCKVEVQGFACSHGSHKYNADLALDRAKAVRDKLIAMGASKDQVVKHLSGGKDLPIFEGMSEREDMPASRRVILQVIGPASGK